MNFRRPIQLGVPLIAFAVMGSMALAQEQGKQGQQQMPMMGHGMMTGGQGMMNQGMMDSGTQGMTGDCPMMGGMMGQGMQGMRGQQMMGSGMMQGGMGPGALFGSRVTPTMNLSAEDVRGYLAVQLDRLNNTRLKVGDIKADDGNITADIVTVDNSLVQRLKVNRHTDAIEYQN